MVPGRSPLSVQVWRGKIAGRTASDDGAHRAVRLWSRPFGIYLS
jgi:hypothetical protein